MKENKIYYKIISKKDIKDLENSRSKLNFPIKSTILEESIDAKIKHRKKREGD